MLTAELPTAAALWGASRPAAAVASDRLDQLLDHDRRLRARLARRALREALRALVMMLAELATSADTLDDLILPAEAVGRRAHRAGLHGGDFDAALATLVAAAEGWPGASATSVGRDAWVAVAGAAVGIARRAALALGAAEREIVARAPEWDDVLYAS